MLLSRKLKLALQAEKGQNEQSKTFHRFIRSVRPGEPGPASLVSAAPVRLRCGPASTGRAPESFGHRDWEEPEAGFLSLLLPSVLGRREVSPRCEAGTGEWLPSVLDKAAAIGNGVIPPIFPYPVRWGQVRSRGPKPHSRIVQGWP